MVAQLQRSHLSLVVDPQVQRLTTTSSLQKDPRTEASAFCDQSTATIPVVMKRYSSVSSSSATLSSRTRSLSISSHSSSCVGGRSSVRSTTDPSHLRSRYLSRLGISQAKPALQDTTNNKPRTIRLLKESSQSFNVALKADHGKDAEPIVIDENTTRSFPFFNFSSTTPSSSVDSNVSTDSKSISLNSSSNTKKSVSFAPEVEVCSIPRHSAYSHRIRQTLWTSPMEMHEAAARNCVEFASEQWDWRKVANDEDMVWYNGERVHPIHFAQQYNLHRHFCAVMSAQNAR